MVSAFLADGVGPRPRGGPPVCKPGRKLLGQHAEIHGLGGACGKPNWLGGRLSIKGTAQSVSLLIRMGGDGSNGSERSNSKLVAARWLERSRVRPC